MTRLSLQEVHFFKCLPSIVKKSIKSRDTVAIREEMFTREELALKFVSRILCNMFFAWIFGQQGNRSLEGVHLPSSV